MPDPGTVVRYAAASPADRNGSFSGSGFPFANQTQAFESTPITGILDVGPGGVYVVDILMPNSFYQRLGSDLLPPTLFISYESGARRVITSVPVGQPIPFRTLTYPAQRRDVSFYDDGDHDILHPRRDALTQEAILRNSGYPTAQPVDFWGPVVPQ